VLTDRFAVSGGGSNTPCSDLSNYCGGKWAGITQRLDYIQGMGFDAIWISPIVANIEGETPYGEAFHGYWTQSIDSTNSHFGTDDDLKALSAALHARNMFLMVDVVVNHVAATALPPNLNYSMYDPFSVPEDFHPLCFITDYANQTDVEQCWLGDTNVPLPDINTENELVQSTMYNWIQKLVGDYSADGLRIDTVKHVRKDFWPGFAEASGVFTIGEVLDNDTSYTGPYTYVLDSILDYPDWFPLTSAFSTVQGNLSALTASVLASQNAYKNGTLMTGSFLENHDQPRFQNLTQDQSLVKNAMTWPFVSDGLPILYYGQEQGYTGGADPANREALWLSGYDTNKSLVSHVKSLNAARKTAIAANKQFLTTQVKYLPQSSSSTLAISKPPLLTLLTNGGNSSSVSWTVPDAMFKGGEALVEVLTCNTMSANQKGGLSVNGNQGMPQVIMPASALSKTGPLCANVATGTGTNGSGAAIGKGASWAGVGAAVMFGLVGLFI